MAKKKKETSFEELMKNIDYTRWLQALIPIMQPILIFGGWLVFSKFDKRADAVSKLIALVEPLPTVDLNVPKPVVLASIFHAIGETLDTFSKLDLDIPIIEELEELKDALVEDIDPLDVTAEFRQALADCNENAKKNLGYLYYVPFTAPAWISSCMFQKGYTVSAKYVRDELF